MNTKIVVLLFLIIYTISLSSALEQNFTSGEIDVEVDIPANQEWFSVIFDVDQIDFGELNTSNESDYTKVNMNFSGNVNATMKPKLQNSGDDIFGNLYFAELGPSTHSSYDQIGEWEMNLSRTYSIGQISKDYFYVKLYLKNYNPIIPFDIVDHQNTVVFEVTPRYD